MEEQNHREYLSGDSLIHSAAIEVIYCTAMVCVKSVENLLAFADQYNLSLSL